MPISTSLVLTLDHNIKDSAQTVCLSRTGRRDTENRGGLELRE